MTEERVLSEREMRVINKYFSKLVRAQPVWIKELFNKGKVAFVIDPSLTVGWEFHKDLQHSQVTKIEHIINAWIEKNPPTFLKLVEVEHVPAQIH